MPTSRTTFGSLALAAYIAAIAAANITTAHYGLVPVGFGLTATAGTYFAGLALMLRNQVQDWLGRRAVLAAIVLGAGLSALTSPSLALASGTAFALGELADMTIYTPLRKRGWARAAATAAPFGALVDTVVFLGLAGFPLTAQGIGGQFAVKTAVTWATVLLATTYRSVRRDPVPGHTIDA